MSSPDPQTLMTKQDLEIYLKSIQKRADHYKAEQLVRPSEYNLKQLNNLDRMAVEAISRFHNQ